MKAKGTNQILSSITERAPLSVILSDICRLACGGDDAAFVFLQDSSDRELRLAAATNLSEDL